MIYVFTLSDLSGLWEEALNAAQLISHVLTDVMAHSCTLLSPRLVAEVILKSIFWKSIHYGAT